MPYTPKQQPQIYTFKNGAQATVHRVGKFTMAHISSEVLKQFPLIPIPTFEVDMGGGKTTQPDPTNVDYLAAVAERTNAINMRASEAMLDYALDIEIEQDELARVTAAMERMGMPLHEISDKVSYLKHCCELDETDLPKLLRMLQGLTEEAITEQQAAFPGDVSGQADRADLTA